MDLDGFGRAFAYPFGKTPTRSDPTRGPLERRTMKSPKITIGNAALFLSGLLLLQACSALFPPDYRPYSHQAGYSDAQIAKDTYEVGYVGPAEFMEIQAKKMAILRAAELTRIAGGRWFRIVSEAAESRKIRKTSHEVTSKPVKDTLFAASDAPTEVKETTTREDTWIPIVTLVIKMEPAETAETLDAETVLREGRASGLLPKKR